MRRLWGVSCLKRKSLKTKLSLAIAMVALLTIALVSFLSNFLINRQFKAYVAKQQVQETQEIVESLGLQNEGDEGWNMALLHAIGMGALEDGYIVRITGAEGDVLWDAQDCDMESCKQLMDEVSARMASRCPGIGGQFTSEDFELTRGGKVVGSVNIGYYGPYFLSEHDFDFLESLNVILVGTGVFSLVLAAIVGWLMAKHICGPIQKTVDVARQMSGGDYLVRIDEKPDALELGELTQTINQLADSLSKQECFRKQLTADVAHELRTPLTTVGTHLEAMVDGVWEASRERLQSCHDEIMRISTIVRDLDSLAKAESSHIHLHKQPLDLGEMVSRVLTSFEIEIARKHLDVTVEGNCGEVCADPDRIAQVIHNLLSNAVKYTRDDGCIHIVLSETEHAVTLKIEDDGIGISEDDKPFIFERFYRADKSRSRSTGGSGIGLAIVKSIVSAHGGQVEVESKLGEGSAFCVWLPK